MNAIKQTLLVSSLVLSMNSFGSNKLIRKMNCEKTVKVDGGTLCVIKPSSTDPRILDKANSGRFMQRMLGFGYHIVGVPTNLKNSSPIHIHLGGSFGKPYNPGKDEISSSLLLSEGMQAGRLMIKLAYDNQYSVNLQTCNKQGKNVDNCAGLVREKKQTGNNVTSLTKTDRFNSVDFRLQKLTSYLKKVGVISRTKSVDWKNLEVSGHSQGAGQTLFIAKFIGVKKACLIAGGYDLPDSVRPGRVELADWIKKKGSKTPKKAITSLVHTNDKFYEKFNYLNDYLDLHIFGNVFETSKRYMTNSDGERITNAHGGIVGAVQLSDLRKRACFQD